MSQTKESFSPPVRLPAFMPTDAVIVTAYDEMMEVLRSSTMRPEPPTENEEVSGGTLTTLFGEDHTTRRRVMNRLVRPDALDYYRESLLIPTMKRALMELRRTPTPDGVYRAELVQFTRYPFVQFSAALAGMDTSDPGRMRKLLGLINAMGDHHRVKFYTGDHRPYIERGLAAKSEFSKDYYEPAYEECPFRPGDEVPRTQHDLLSLLAAELDPHWHDQDLCVKETFTSIFAAGVGTSSTMMTNSIDQLSRWLLRCPDQEHRLMDLEFLGGVLQETLRLHPIFPAFGRVANEDVTLSTGRTIRAGQWVAAFPGIANRDTSTFGDDADEFNPDRELPPSTQRYGTGFGAGSHQCLGLRVVLGNDGIGSHAHVLKLLLEAGVRRDLERQPRKEPSERDTWEHYPVVFTKLDELDWNLDA
jgi:cytochrome P450